MGAGKLDRRIDLQRDTPVQDSAGQPVEGWSSIGIVWASRKDASDGEKFADGQELGQRVTRFTVRSSAITRTVTAKDRIIYSGDDYDILGVKETSAGRNQFIEITAQVNNADAAS